ncbi:hypothetical protein BD769DRAFT_1359454, partial [Suillus cothurnatus]
MRVELNDVERLRDLAESTETIPEVSVGSMSILCETAGEPNAKWRVTSVPLGDPLSERAEQLLVQHAPYPGDDLENERSFSDQRFVIYRTSDTHHVIMDGARRSEEDLLVPTRLLQNEKFRLSDWYCTQLAQRFSLPRRRTRLMHSGVSMGEPILERICEILNGEPNFPGTRSPERFTCTRTVFADDVTLEIHDQNLDFRVWVLDTYMSNPRLNITQWYARRLLRAYHRLHDVLLEKELEGEFDQLRLL